MCDAGSRSCTVDASNCPADAPRPETQEIETLVDMFIKSPSVLANGAYANNSDSNTVIVSISGSTVEDKDIVGW